MSMKIKQLPNSERPYEKLEMYGANMLSNSELLAIIIKTGTKEETSISLAQRILSLNDGNLKKEKQNETLKKEENAGKCENLRFLQDISLQELMKIKGIGRVKAIQLKAVCELAKRMSRPIDVLNIKINTAKDVANLLMEEMKYEKREIVKLVMLNSKNEMQKIVDITTGTTSQAVLNPKDVLIEPIKMGISKIILVHNHPSGDPTPSKTDIAMTQTISKVAFVLGIQLLDHIVIGDNKYESIIDIMKNKSQKESIVNKNS